MIMARIVKYLFLLIFLSGCTSANNQTVDEFAKTLKEIISYQKLEKFMEIPCFPSGCEAEANLQYIFGDGKKKSFVLEFMQRRNIKIKIFGPYQYSEDSNYRNYSLMFYDPNIVQFNDNGFLSEADRQDLWWKGYIETVVSVSSENGEWGFHRTPFYYGAHIPWSEDY